ncbi:MAG TPA: M20 family peptidase [Vicinamibacteria bacterium]
MTMKTAWRALALGAALLVAVLLVKTARLTSRQLPASPLPPAGMDTNAAAERLAGALRFRTVSQPAADLDRAAEFRGLREYLARSFPRVHSDLRLELVGDSLLYEWPGRDPALAPVLLAAHLDVVPVDPATVASWAHPPFAGRIADGYVWGRGAMDDKAAVVAIQEAVEGLLAEGHQPARTLFLAFGHDEEIGGHAGAETIAERLRARGVKLDYVLDEGMIVAEGILPLPRPVALVGVAEKGSLSLELRVDSEGGHSSIPPPHTAIGILAAAVSRLEAHPVPGGLEGVARQTFEAIGPEMGLAGRLVFANLWLFQPLVERRLAARPNTDAVLRTTTAVTIIEGGVKENVLPARARAVVNFRLRPGDTIAAVTGHVRRVVNDPRVAVERYGETAWEASPVSSTDSRGFRLLAAAIRGVFPDVVVAPALVLGATDGRHYAKLTGDVYRFLPQRCSAEDLKRYHGTNERLSAEGHARGIAFYRELIRTSTR